MLFKRGHQISPTAGTCSWDAELQPSLRTCYRSGHTNWAKRWWCRRCASNGMIRDTMLMFIHIHEQLQNEGIILHKMLMLLHLRQRNDALNLILHKRSMLLVVCISHPARQRNQVLMWYADHKMIIRLLMVQSRKVRQSQVKLLRPLFQQNNRLSEKYG